MYGVYDLPNNWQEINEEYKNMVNKGNANGILHAFDGQPTHDPDSQILADALNSGNQAKVNEIIARYKGSNETAEQFKQRAISAIQSL